jgi:hypothetical protein
VKGFESSSVEIDHDYENELKSVLKVHLYKKFIQIDASAKGSDCESVSSKRQLLLSLCRKI